MVVPLATLDGDLSKIHRESARTIEKETRESIESVRGDDPKRDKRNSCS